MDSTIYLSETGKIAKQYWYEIPKRFPYIVLDEFVVMPNHLHGTTPLHVPASSHVPGAKNTTPLRHYHQQKSHVTRQFVLCYSLIQGPRDI